MKKIKLTQGLFALVDDEDYERLNQFQWHASLGSRGTKMYAIRCIRVDGKKINIRMHREILGLPREFDGRVGDHLNSDGLDNRRENLEIVTQEENMNRVPSWRRKKQAEVAL